METHSIGWARVGAVAYGYILINQTGVKVQLSLHVPVRVRDEGKGYLTFDRPVGIPLLRAGHCVEIRLVRRKDAPPFATVPVSGPGHLIKRDELIVLAREGLSVLRCPS